ncbi:MAG: hypothetical protein L0Z53_05475 [Acidobacteriales bacterium]|nr:hypothetical protein [Terriglobales bacterium]
MPVPVPRLPRAIPTLTSEGDVVAFLKRWQSSVRHLLRRPTNPARVPNFKATSHNNGILLEWGSVRGADGFEVVRADTADFSGETVSSLIRSGKQRAFFDAVPLGTTRHYKIRATAGTLSEPQTILGPLSFVVSATSGHPLDDISLDGDFDPADPGVKIDGNPARLALETPGDVRHGWQMDNAAQFFDDFDFAAAVFRERWDRLNQRRGLGLTPTGDAFETAGNITARTGGPHLDAEDTNISGVDAQFISGFTAAGMAEILRAGTSRARINATGFGVDRTPSDPLEAEGEIQSFGGSAALSINSRSGADAGQQYSFYADNGLGRLWRNADRALFSDSRWGMFGTPSFVGLHVFGIVSRIEAAGQVRLDFNNTLVGQVTGFEHNDDTDTLDMVRTGVTRVLTMPANASRIGIGKLPTTHPLEAQGGIQSFGAAAELATERRDSLGNRILLYSDGGAMRLFDSEGAADRAAFGRANGKLVLGGGAPGTAFLKVEGDDWIDSNKRVADPRRLLASHVSYRPLSNPLTATDAGTTATVNIAAFTQRVAGVDVSVNSGSVSTLSFGTLYFIYYDDAGFAGGSVTYNATTVKETALNGSGRFFVGSIITPKDGAADTSGNNDGGAGAQTGEALILYGSGVVGNSWNNPINARDGNSGTFADFTQTPATETITVSGFGAWPQAAKKVTVQIYHQVATAFVNGTSSMQYDLGLGAGFVTFANSAQGTGGRLLFEYNLTTAEIAQVSGGGVSLRVSVPGNGGAASAVVRAYELQIRVES